ncbi:peptidylprolyl isomerase [Flavobacteriaceae bacterium R38]|nr:peptidylprolyl isomerase [Flavobacteriaceae bacterium R38]
MKRIKLLSLILITLLVSCKSTNYRELGNGLFVDIQTNKGNIVIKFTQDATPVTVANFITLAEGTSPFVSDSLKGKKYYEGVIFHRVIKDFMIQGGDPTGTGAGTPGYRFDNEIVDSLVHDRGVISMANAGPDTNGSQFFITHQDYPSLNGGYSVFGKVVQGMEVVDTIANIETKIEGNLRNKPVDDVVINTVKIVRQGKDAKAFDAVRVMTDYFEGITKREEERIARLKAVTEKLVGEFSTQKEEAKELPSGLKILFTKEGDGEKPKTGNKVLVNYAGYFTDGNLFDSNIESVAKDHGKFDQRRKDARRYSPVSMDYSPDAQLIPGFREGLQLMKIGDKIRLFIPPHLGYGEADYGPIPGNSDLVFDLEIVSIQ